VSNTLDSQIVALPGLGRAGLQERWCSLFKTAPPAAFTPDLLARGIAWRLQEKALGGLSPEARRLLSVGGRVDEVAPRRRRSLARPTLRPGNRLVRRWRGRTYVVDVTEGGLMYDGETFSSLSVIASKITGTRWSGPKFFGLVA
jgi:hypothetical protein